MDGIKASELISQNLAALYGYVFSRLYDKDKTEDVVSEIVCEILASARNLKNSDAFWGYAWKIAENTFRRFLRREELIQRSRQQEQADSDDMSGVCNAVEQEYIEREDRDEKLYLLRRELSLLGKAYREVCIAYYIENKSCSQIAKEREISVETVKQYLFKTRRLLKEGVNMTRTLGEKSYNPGTFVMNFWGDRNRYSDLFKRKLPGTIMLAAYRKPVSAEELSVELGVSMPYLEDEIEILEAAGLLERTGKKYQTNIVIFTEDFERDFEKNTAHCYKEAADKAFEKVKELLPEIRRMDFQGNDYDDNRLLAGILNIAMVRAYDMARKKSPMGAPHKLTLGGSGWIYGHDNRTNRHFRGITMETWNESQTAWFSAENYSVFKECQLYDHSCFSQRAEAMCGAVLGEMADKDNPTLPHLIETGFVSCRDGRLSANFPVFDSGVFSRLCELLKPVSEIAADCMIDISDRAETLLKGCVPAGVREQCGDIAKINYRLDTAAIMMEELTEDGKITVPEGKTPLCVWGVRK